MFFDKVLSPISWSGAIKHSKALLYFWWKKTSKYLYTYYKSIFSPELLPPPKKNFWISYATDITKGVKIINMDEE